MQRSSAAAGAALALVLALAQVSAPAQAVQLVRLSAAKESASETPVAKVVKLIESLKESVIADGRAEQKSYDKFACWCEDTMGRKAQDISNGKEQIEDLLTAIKRLKAEIASHGSEIQQVKKDLAANVEARREASELRDKEHAGYQEDKTESEQCIGALEAAVKVLTGAGAKKGFLETMQEAQLLSVVAGVRTVLARPSTSKALSSRDLDAVQRFVEQPEDFVGGRAGAMSAAQIANNPFGDYAPQSTQIQGILKGMYDTFVGDMEKANAEEAEAQKSHEELMRTKMMEADTLQATLERHTLDEATKTKKLAESQEILDDTKEQLEADEKFFAETKDGCQVKASEWSERVRMRSEELAGIGKCIQILTSEDAKSIFENATTTFVQLSASRALRRGAGVGDKRTAVVSKLAQLAAHYKSTNTAAAAQLLREGGHFDKVMASIDAMVEVLRKQEQDDIEHRDRCQGADGKNKNDMEDLNAHIDKAGKSIKRLEGEEGELEKAVSAVKGEINATMKDRAERLDLRNDEVAEFRQAMKDDAAAVELLQQAIVSMTEFYRRNKMKKLALVHRGSDEQPEYTVDPDKAPETSWSGANYGGRRSESEGLVAILQMVKEDLANEMKTARADDADAQKLYEKEDSAMKETLDKQLALKLANEKALNEVQEQIEDTKGVKSSKESDLKAETDLKDSIYSDCSWVETHFEKRRTARKTEMDGLAEAKSYLSGVEAGDQI